jgi:hypothetical protein
MSIYPMPITYDQKYTNFCQLAPIPEHYELIPEYDEPIITKRRFWQRFCICVQVEDQIISKEIPVKKQCIPSVCQHQ